MNDTNEKVLHCYYELTTGSWFIVTVLKTCYKLKESYINEFQKDKEILGNSFCYYLIVPSILNHMEYSIPIHAAEETLASFNFTYGDNKTTWVATATMQDSICIPTISLNT